MPRYEIGAEKFRRKNLHLPCAIHADLDAMTDEERARVYRQTYWADLITTTEWPCVLRHDGVKAYVRSKLKRKMAGWLMALSRIAVLNPPLFIEALDQAAKLYAEQVTARGGASR